MEFSKIEWCDHTYNLWEGCTKVSPGCEHCYAENRNKRWHGGANWGKGAPRRRTANWRRPLKWNEYPWICDECGEWFATNAPVRHFKRVNEASPVAVLCTGTTLHRARVFCASLSDWLDDEVEIAWLVDLLALIHATPNLNWMMLSKRPQNFVSRICAAIQFIRLTKHDTPLDHWLLDWRAGTKLPENIWMGTTAEDQKRADERVPLLLAIPARVHFLSCEPLLGRVSLNSSLGGTRWMGGSRGCCGMHRGIGTPECPRELHHHHDERCKKGLDLVIAGGESGPEARPMHPDWARELRDECAATMVPFLFKQWGEWGPCSTVTPGDAIRLPMHGFDDGVHLVRGGKARAGRLLDGVEHHGTVDESVRKDRRA